MERVRNNRLRYEMGATGSQEEYSSGRIDRRRRESPIVGHSQGTYTPAIIPPSAPDSVKRQETATWAFIVLLALLIIWSLQS